MWWLSTSSARCVRDSAARSKLVRKLCDRPHPPVSCLAALRGFVSSCGWVVALPLGRREHHRQGDDDAGVYTDRRKRPLEAVLGHLCTLLRRELRRVARAPQQPPWRADSAPLGGPPLPWPGKQALREWRRRQAGVFTGVSTHTNPRGAPKRESFLPYPCQGHPCPCHASCPSAYAWTFWDLRPWPASSCPSSCSSRPTA